MEVLKSKATILRQKGHDQKDLKPSVALAVSIQAPDGSQHGNVMVDLPEVFQFVVVFYGSIGSLWLLHWHVSKQGQSPFMDRMKVGLLCLTWASMSIGMHVLNKSLATTLKTPSLITIAQMIVAVVLMGCTSFRDVLQASGKQLLTWMVVPMFFAAMLITSFYTYEIISLSLLTVLRNLTPLIVLPMERLVMPAGNRPQVNIWVVGPLLIMICGAVVYSGSIKDLSILGITFAVVNMIIAISDRLIQRRLLTTECQDLPSSVCTFVNNLFGMIPTCLLAWSTGEFAAMDAETHAAWTDPKVLTIVLLSGFVGLGICYFGFECQRAISATSFFVLQNVSKVAVVSMGVIIFHDPIKSPITVLGLLMSLGGSFLYGHGQLSSSKAEEKAAKSGEEQLQKHEA